MVIGVKGIMGKWGEMGWLLQGMVLLQMSGNLFSRFEKAFICV